MIVTTELQCSPWQRRCAKCKAVVEWRGTLAMRPKCPGCGAPPKGEDDARDARIAKRFDPKWTVPMFEA